MVQLVAQSGIDDSAGIPEYPKVRPFLFVGTFINPGPCDLNAFIEPYQGLAFREKITALETALSGLPQLECELNHYFAPGVYTRECLIPAGTLVIGKIHLHEHMNILISGDVSIMTEFDGVQRIQGPKFMTSKAGTKRFLYAHTDLVWSTIHLNPDDERDIETLEAGLVVTDYKMLPLSEAAYQELAGG